MTIKTNKSSWLTFALLFIVALVMYLTCMRPVGAYFATGIPYGMYNGTVQELHHGDQLQLQYYFDLFDACLRGRIPWWFNPYEFSTPYNDFSSLTTLQWNDYYIPFSLPYVIIKLFASDAFAWNASQFLSVFIGILFCYLLARRFGAERMPSVFCSVIANCVPYRWVVLAGGQPTGFCMGLVPGVALAMDYAVRDRKITGGVFAGIMLAACCGMDLHCFFFAALAIVPWGITALIKSGKNPFKSIKDIAKLAAVMVPVALFAGLSFVAAKSVDTGSNVTRGLKDIVNHTPQPLAILFHGYGNGNMPDEIYLGPAISVLLFACGLILIILAFRKILSKPSHQNQIESKDIVIGAVFAIGIVACILLALAINGYPRIRFGDWIASKASIQHDLQYLHDLGGNDEKNFVGLPLLLARKFVPKFLKIRQPIKVLCLLPTLITQFLAISCVFISALKAPSSNAVTPQGVCCPIGMRKWCLAHRFLGPVCQARVCTVANAVLFVAAIVAFGVFSQGIRTGISLLPAPNKAYITAVEYAKSAKQNPRALVLPVWPGDSAWSSIYEYNAVRAGLPLLNCYRAVAKENTDYQERIYGCFAPSDGKRNITLGNITDNHINALKYLGVTSVILQENAWPPNVSCYPFSATLNAFICDPRFDLISVDRGAWCFAFKPENTNNGQRSAIAYPIYKSPVVKYSPDLAEKAIVPDSDGIIRIRICDLSHNYGTIVMQGEAFTSLHIRPDATPACDDTVRGPLIPLAVPEGKYKAQVTYEYAGAPCDIGQIRISGNADGQTFSGDISKNLEIEYDGKSALDFHFDYRGQCTGDLFLQELIIRPENK